MHARGPPARGECGHEQATVDCRTLGAPHYRDGTASIGCLQRICGAWRRAAANIIVQLGSRYFRLSVNTTPRENEPSLRWWEMRRVPSQRCVRSLRRCDRSFKLPKMHSNNNESGGLVEGDVPNVCLPGPVCTGGRDPPAHVLHTRAHVVRMHILFNRIRSVATGPS